MELFREFGKFCSPTDLYQERTRAKGYHDRAYLVEDTGLVAPGKRFLNNFGLPNAILERAVMSY